MSTGSAAGPALRTVYDGSAIINGGLKESNFHDFMGKSVFEQAADDYAAGLIKKEDL